MPLFICLLLGLGSNTEQASSVSISFFCPSRPTNFTMKVSTKSCSCSTSARDTLPRFRIVSATAGKAAHDTSAKGRFSRRPACRMRVRNSWLQNCALRSDASGKESSSLANFHALGGGLTIDGHAPWHGLSIWSIYGLHTSRAEPR